jgi:SAM-dependent methyltransferase/uncharacterized protein YbaR (Trm112 family)
VRQSVLNYIVCPRCGGEYDLTASVREADHVMQGCLRCRGCGSEHPIEDGVPIILDRTKEEGLGRRSAERFGYEWEKFDFITEAYERQFLDWVFPIGRDFFTDKTVLDAGCGKGRHAMLAARFGAREVIGIDVAGGSVRAAFRNTRELKNVHIIRADIYDLPFRREAFDYIYSIGVLHHLPNPREGFLRLVKPLKRDGRISVWVYAWEGNWWVIRLVSPIRTCLTSKLPLVVTRGLAFVLGAALQLVLKGVYRPVNEIPWLRSLSGKLFYNEYLYYISRFSFRENYSIVFDHLLPDIALYIRREELGSWFLAANLKGVVITKRTNNSWRGMGEKA